MVDIKIYNYKKCSVIYSGNKIHLPKPVNEKIKENWNQMYEKNSSLFNGKLLTIK